MIRTLARYNLTQIQTITTTYSLTGLFVFNTKPFTLSIYVTIKCFEILGDSYITKNFDTILQHDRVN